MALKHHVSFAVPIQDDVDRTIVEHFCGLGYRLVEEADGEWCFHRGSKFAVLWRMNIRTYDTELLVRANLQPDGRTWVSCDFEVWTFMTLVFHGDVATLEAEARELESVLRHQVGRRRPAVEPAVDGAEQKAERPPSTQFRRVEDRIQ
jgi:hypothetical protein